MNYISRSKLTAWLVALGVVCLLAGCGSNSGGGTTTATTKTITVTLTDGITGAAVANVVVQLDQAGATATTNASGVATFSGVSTGIHDIHMFPAATSGYQWESIYQTSASTIKWDLSKNDISYVEYSGTVTNLGVGDSLTLLLEDAATGNAFSNKCTVTGTSYTCSIKGDGIAIGASGAFNLWALEKNGSKTVVDGVQLQNKANYTVTTTARGGTAVIQNITFNTTLPANTNLLTIARVIPPAGVTATLTAATMPMPGFEPMGYSTVLGNPIPAYNPFATTSPVWAWSSNVNNAGTLTWAILQKATIGASNINLKSSFTALPAIAAQNGQGAANPKIAFTPAQGSFSGHAITIDETATNKTLWNITTPTTTTSITLPTIPAAVTATLANGTTYNLTVMGMEISGGTSYNNLVAGSYDPTLISYSDIELVQAATTFTR
ncbi:MAG: hypothetical protein Q9M13_09360 [Mariprofundales bacterium]|nr:hypothetical protein [Mariprofundales bacterium]